MLLLKEFLTQQKVDRWPVAVVLDEMLQDLFDIYQKAMSVRRRKTKDKSLIINVYFYGTFLIIWLEKLKNKTKPKV